MWTAKEQEKEMNGKTYCSNGGVGNSVNNSHKLWSLNFPMRSQGLFLYNQGVSIGTYKPYPDLHIAVTKSKSLLNEGGEKEKERQNTRSNNKRHKTKENPSDKQGMHSYVSMFMIMFFYVHYRTQSFYRTSPT